MNNWIRLGARLEEAGSGSSGMGGTGQPATPAPTPTPESSQTPTTPPAQPQQPSSDSGKPPEGYVPAEQLRAVSAERDRLKNEASTREEEDQKKKGEFEQIAQKREQERDEWKDRFTTTARRSAFIAQIAQQVADPEAAYKLAQADGLLKDVPVDNDGNAEAEKVKAAVKSIMDTYKFLKAGNGSFGGERSGTQPDNTGFDPAKASSRELLREGIRRAGTSGAGRS